MSTPAWPDGLGAFFTRSSRRFLALAAARGVAVGLAALSPLLVFYWMSLVSIGVLVPIALMAGIAGGFVAAWRAPRRADVIAARVEARTPAPRNLLITAAELLIRPSAIRPDVRDVVFRDASEAASRVDLSALFPWGRAAIAATAAIALWVVGLSITGSFVTKARDLVAASGPGLPSISRITVVVTPPAYAGRAAETLRDPERIEALAGSRVHVSVAAEAASMELIGVGGRHVLARDDSGRFSGEVTADANGFLALQPFGAGDATGVRHVIALSVTPDRPPAARITAPGKDVFLPAATAEVPVTISATDDIGLASLRLTYTKVSGSGESFEFTNGEFPVQLTRKSGTEWSGAGTIPLPSLNMAPGDMLVYRALVADSRPGGDVHESDAFVIEILAPGGAMSEGFAIDENKDKYAISQQMVILKTERLIARKSTLSAEAFADEAQIIAAEQRKVRAEFVFMMGGEFEDLNLAGGDLNEEKEAANESELLAGRLQNNGRRDIILATRRMSEAAAHLARISPVQALPQERAALVALQRAFTRSRYILRVLTPRERIDDQRRLSGTLADAAGWRRPVADAVDDPRTATLRRALARVAPLAALPRYGATEANQLAAIAELILKVDAVTASLQKVARGFAQAGASIASGRSAAETAALIDTAAVQLSAAMRAALASAPESAAPSAGARLRGALADALRRGGGAR